MEEEGLSKVFIVNNISLFFKVIHSSLWNEEDRVIVISDSISITQIENIYNFCENRKVELEVVKSYSMLPMCFSFFGVVFYTYLMPALRLNNYVFKLIAKRLKIKLNSKIYITHEIPPIMSVLLNEMRVSLIEDGKLNYNYSSLSRIHKIFRFVFGYQDKHLVGTHRNIVELHVSSPEHLIFRMSNFSDKKISKLETNYIKESFFSEKYKVILATQPLAKAGFCSEAEQSNIYRRITSLLIDYYGRENVAIKPHPSEVEIELYNSYQVGIIDGNIPFEMINIPEQTVCISLFSSLSHRNTIQIIDSNYKEEIRHMVENGVVIDEYLSDIFREMK